MVDRSRTWMAAAILLALLPGLAWGAVGADQPTPAGTEPAQADADDHGVPKPIVWDDVPEPLPPDRRRSESHQDRVDALALYSAGRSLEMRGEFARALRRYQRALRYDPQARGAAAAIVELALRLDRHDEAVRVVLKVPDVGVFQPNHLLTLGAHLIEKGDWQRAVAVYEKLVADRAGAEPTSVDVALALEMGRLYHLVERYDKAAECFGRVREGLDDPEQAGLDAAEQRDLVGKDGVTYRLMGDAFLRAGRFDDALAAFEKLHQVAPNRGLRGYDRARVAFETGNPAGALDELQAYFDERLAGEGVAPYELLSRCLEKLDRQEEIVARLEKLHEADPDNVPLAYALADAFRQAGRFDEAGTLYLALIEKSPTLTAYRSLLAIYRETRRADALLELLNEAASQGVALDLLGGEEQSLVEEGGLIRALLDDVRARLRDDPDGFDHDLLLAVALLALDARDRQTAQELAESALRTDSEGRAERLLTWGLGLLSQAEYGEAAATLQRGLDEGILADDNPVFYYYLAGALEMDGKTDEALVAARKAVDLEPDAPRFASRVAWVLYHGQRRDEAARAYAELIEKFDSDFRSAEVRQVMREARLVMSNIAVLEGKLSEAVEWLEQVLDEFPDDVAALNDLGYLWADENVRLERAHEMIRRAVEGDPENVAYRDSLGWVLYRLGRFDEAVAELEKAAAGDDEPDPVILDHLGDAYRAAGEPEKAADAWQQAAEAFHEAGEAEKAQAVRGKIEK